MNSIGKIIMFLSSYSPLYIFIITLNYTISDIKNSLYRIIVPKEITKVDVIFYILLGLIIVANLGLCLLVKISSKSSETVKIQSVENGNDKILDYILAYIVSFMTTNFAEILKNDSKVIITAILIQILLGYLYCKSNMLYINPVLNIIGYDIFLIETPNNNVIVLTKDKRFYKDTKKEINRNGYKNIEMNCFSKNIYIL